MREITDRVNAISGVRCERVRARTSGPYTFVDVRVSVDRTMPLDGSRDIMARITKRTREVLAGADVVVQVEPREIPEESLPSKIGLIALQEQGIKGVHKIEVRRIGGKTIVDLHLEVDGKLSVEEAHGLVDRFERRARGELSINEITTHIETHACDVAVGEDLTGSHAHVVERVKEIVARYPRIKGCHDVVVRRVDGRLSVNMHCELLKDEPLELAHELSTMLERIIGEEVKGVDHVTIHIEPAA